jgi:hypothetical protein
MDQKEPDWLTHSSAVMGCVNTKPGEGIGAEIRALRGVVQIAVIPREIDIGFWHNVSGYSWFQSQQCVHLDSFPPVS